VGEGIANRAGGAVGCAVLSAPPLRRPKRATLSEPADCRFSAPAI